MSYTKVNYDDVEPVADALHFLRDPLDCSELGVTILECDPGWVGKEHDHSGNDQEEVYVLVEGGVTVTVDGDTVEMTPGDSLRMDPDATRQVHNGDEESLLVLVGSP